jgi:basic membrane protein A
MKIKQKQTGRRGVIALCVSLAMVAAACGSDDAAEPEPVVTEAEVEAPVEEPVVTEAEVEAPVEEPAEEPTEEPAEEPEVDAIIAAFDANGDGTVTIGVAAAGPRDDNGYYQSLVNFAEEYSSENGFAPPIVSDNIGPAEAAQSLADLAQQGVDILMVGASEIAEPLPDLTEQFPDIFWYCNCGAGFQELPGLAQATDWGAAVHYSAGVAMGAVLQEQGSTSSVFLGCCDINFEVEAYQATLYGIQSVDPSFTMEYVGTGDFEFDFDNSANATAALSNAQANGATLAYAYLGGALDPVGQLATDEGMAVFAAGPADACERDIPWTGSVVFDGGVYASQALTLIIDGELSEGSTYQFPTEAGLNGALLCDPSAEASAAVDGAFGLLASFDEALYADLGAISGAAYGG